MSSQPTPTLRRTSPASIASADGETAAPSSGCLTLDRLLACAETLSFAPGTVVFRPGQLCSQFLWITEGSARVYKHSHDEREITLYRVGPDQPCFISLSNLVYGTPIDVYGVVETAVLARAIRRQDFAHALEHSPDLARYLLRRLAERLHALTALTAEVAFNKLELRLACYLGHMFERSRGQSLKLTHEEIAHELGTSREVVSRLLKQFEHQGCLRLSRGTIERVSLQGLPGVGNRTA
jgi:CRP/FNR family transcriptional regulator